MRCSEKRIEPVPSPGGATASFFAVGSAEQLTRMAAERSKMQSRLGNWICWIRITARTLLLSKGSVEMILESLAKRDWNRSPVFAQVEMEGAQVVEHELCSRSKVAFRDSRGRTRLSLHVSVDYLDQFEKLVCVLVGFAPVFRPVDTTLSVDQHCGVKTYFLKLVVGLEALAAIPTEGLKAAQTGASVQL